MRSVHKDRLSTFSFSNAREGPSVIARKLQELSSTGEHEGEDEEITDNLPVDTHDVGSYEPSIEVDNFHNNINIDHTANHADRFSTFSLSDVAKQPTMLEDSRSSRFPSREMYNQDSRLGAFSFGRQPQTGPEQPPDVPDPSPSITTAASDDDGISGTISDTPRRISNHDDRLRTYSLPQSSSGTSLSSLASAVSIKSRNDRIQEIKAKNDPRLLHPDGMNTPRLNSKGDVMSIGSADGKPSVFQRIEEQVGQKAQAEDVDDREDADNENTAPKAILEEDGQEDTENNDDKPSNESAKHAK